MKKVLTFLVLASFSLTAPLQQARAQVLREIVESLQVFNSLYNEGWVARCYYLYLRRGPDANGFASWMSTLNSAGDYRGIIFGFIYSIEYQLRFQ